MALVLTPAQRILNSTGMAEIIHANRVVRLYGKRGTLQHFGFTVQNPAGDLAFEGVDRVVARPGYRRSRWLGDIVKSGVRANNAMVFKYPSQRGSALPGVPIVLENLTTQKKWTVQLDGEIGVLFAWWSEHRPPFDVQIWGKTGNAYKTPLLHTPPSPGG